MMPHRYQTQFGLKSSMITPAAQEPIMPGSAQVMPKKAMYGRGSPRARSASHAWPTGITIISPTVISRMATTNSA